MIVFFFYYSNILRYSNTTLPRSILYVSHISRYLYIYIYNTRSRCTEFVGVRCVRRIYMRRSFAGARWWRIRNEYCYRWCRARKRKTVVCPGKLWPWGLGSTVRVCVKQGRRVLSKRWVWGGGNRGRFARWKTVSKL